MRLAYAFLPLVLFNGCSPDPAAVIQVRPISGSNVGHETISVLELDIPADATVFVAVGDRIDQLDVEQSGKFFHLQRFDAKAGERLTVTARSQLRKGDDVLKSFVEPLGGSAAVDAVVASAPAFRQSALVDLETIIEGPGRSTRSGFTFPSTPAMETKFNTAGVLSPGAPLRLIQWVTSKNGVTPGTVLRGADQFAFDRPVSEYSEPLWTLWLQVQPSATEEH